MRIRSVSPLIATIILIALTVAIGAIIVGWGRSYIQKQVSCLGVGFEILSLKFNSSTNNVSSVEVINSGDVKISSGERIYFVFEDSLGNRETVTTNLNNSDWNPGDKQTFLTGGYTLKTATNKPIKVWLFISGCPDKISSIYIIT